MSQPSQPLKSGESPESPVSGPLKPRYSRRANKLRFPDGSERWVRYQSRAEGESNQALADFFGASPDLPPRRNLRSIETILSEISNRYDVEEHSIAPELLSRAWQQAMGDYIATQSQLISVLNETAIIRCLHPAVRFELNKRTRSIITALNQRLGEGSIKRIRLQHG